MHDVHVYSVLMGDVLCGDGAHNAHVVDNPLRLTRRAIKQLTEVGVGVGHEICTPHNKFMLA